MGFRLTPYRAGTGSNIRSALDDVLDSMGRWRVWCVLAWNDVAMRYRRSAIGPLWITLQTAVWALAIGIVYGSLFAQDIKAFLPHVATGIVMWSLIGGLINDSAVAFSHSAPYLQQAQTPKTIFVIRVVVRQAIIFLHNSVIVAGCVLWAGLPVGIGMVSAIAGLLLVFSAGAGIGLAVATIGARFRDLVQAIQSLLQVMFFLTPVMWKSEMLSDRARPVIVDWNPFAVMIDVVRGPLLSEPVSARCWLFGLSVSCASLVAGFVVFAKYRGRITYWL